MQTGEFQEREQEDILSLVKAFEKVIRCESSTYFEEDSLERIISWYQENQRMDRALQAADYALSINGFSATLFLKKAELLFELHQYEEAFALTEKAAAFDPSELEIYYLRSDIFMQWDKPEEAISSLNHALQIASPEEKDGLFVELAEVYEDMEKFDAVFRCLENALQLNPNNLDALQKMWFAADITERYAQSIELHEQLIDREPYQQLAWYNLGKAHFGLQQYREAEDAYRYVVAINEQFGPVYRDLGESLLRQENYKEALKVFAEALEHTQPQEEVHFSMGICEEQLGKAQSARHHYRQAIMLDPYFDEAYYRLALTWLRDDKPQQAHQNCRKAVVLAPENDIYLSTLGRCCEKLDRQNEAVDCFEKATQLRPDDIHNWTNLCGLLMDSGRTDDALRASETALGTCGELPDLIFLKSACLFGAGKVKQATLYLEKGLALDEKGVQRLLELFPYLSENTQFRDILSHYKN